MERERLYVDFAGGQFVGWTYDSEGRHDVRVPQQEYAIRRFARRKFGRVILTAEASRFERRAAEESRHGV